MRGAYFQYLRSKGEPKCCGGKCHTTETQREKDKEAAELRLARIANGVEPGYKNGEKYSDASPKSGD